MGWVLFYIPGDVFIRCFFFSFAKRCPCYETFSIGGGIVFGLEYIMYHHRQIDRLESRVTGAVQQ